MKPFHILLIGGNEQDIILMLDAFKKVKNKTKISLAKNRSEVFDFLLKEGGCTEVERPDLILLEITSPDFIGYDVLEEIKKKQSLKNVPVIPLLTSSNQKDIHLAYENSFAAKPIDMEDFISAVLKNRGVWDSAFRFTN